MDPITFRDELLSLGEYAEERGRAAASAGRPIEAEQCRVVAWRVVGLFGALLDLGIVQEDPPRSAHVMGGSDEHDRN